MKDSSWATWQLLKPDPPALRWSIPSQGRNGICPVCKFVLMQVLRERLGWYRITGIGDCWKNLPQQTHHRLKSPLHQHKQTQTNTQGKKKRKKKKEAALPATRHFLSGWGLDFYLLILHLKGKRATHSRMWLREWCSRGPFTLPEVAPKAFEKKNIKSSPISQQAWICSKKEWA